MSDADVLTLAAEIWDPLGIAIWLKTRNKQLDGHRPIDLLKTGRSAEVVALLNQIEVRTEVDRIVQNYAETGDDEQAHTDEDALLNRLVRDHCPPEIVAEVARLASTDFSRWCA
jgi:hypothetical protein